MSPKKKDQQIDFRPNGPLYRIENLSLTGLDVESMVPMMIKPFRRDDEGKIIGILMISIPKGYIISKFRFEKDSMDPNGKGFELYFRYSNRKGVKGEQIWHPDLRPTIFGFPVYILGHSVTKL